MLTDKLARKCEAYAAASPHRLQSPGDQSAWPSLIRRLVAATGVSRSAVQRVILTGEACQSQSVGAVYYALNAEGLTWEGARALYQDRRAYLAGEPSKAAELKRFETFAAGGKLARGEPISHRERRYLNQARLEGFKEAAAAPLGNTGLSTLATLRAWVLTWVETEQENAPESDQDSEAPKTLTLTETETQMQHSSDENSSNVEDALSLRLSPFGAVAIASVGKRPTWGVGATEEEARSKCSGATGARKRADCKWVAFRASEPGSDGGYALTAYELVCFDLDVKEGKNGVSDLASLVDKLGELPDTVISSTPSGGFHVYFRVPSELGSRITNGKLGGFDSIDVRACGGFLAELGEGRSILADHPVAFLPEGWGAALPLRDAAREPASVGGRVEAVHRAADAVQAFTAACKEYAPAVQGSDGHKAIFRLAMYARDLGLPPAESEPLAFIHYNPRCVPPWGPDERHDFTHQFFGAWDRTDAKAGAPGQASLELERWPDFAKAKAKAKASLASEAGITEASERSLAELLAVGHGPLLRFAGGQWLAWSGTLWVGGTEGEALAFDAVARTARGVLKLAADCDGEERRKLTLCAERALTAKGTRDVLTLAQHLDPFRACEDDFDGDPWLLNLANGTLDLRKLADLPRFADGTADLRALEILPHASERMCSQVAGVEFDPLAPRERWDAYLNWALPGQDDTNRFLQTWAGYCLTGLVEAQVFVNLHGPPGSGKSTFLSCFRAMMGDYGVTLSPSAVVYREEETAFSLDALAKVRKKRFAIIPELPGRKRLDVQRIKALTGDGVNVAKELYRGNVEYRSTAKLMFASNDHMVVDRDANDGFWRRLLLLLMCQPALKSGQPGYAKDWLTRIEAERSGLLNWALEGLHRYLSEGLVAPASVQQAVQDYQRSEDALGEFCEENLEYDADAFMTFASIRERYVRSRGPRFAKPSSRAFNPQLLAALPSRLGPESAQEKPKRAEGRGLPVRWKDDKAGPVPFDAFVAGLSPQPAR